MTTSAGDETAITTVAYDGLALSQTDAMGRTAVSTYNPTGTLATLVTSVGTPFQYSLSYRYSPFDQLSEVLELNSGTVLSAFDYNTRGFMISRSDIDSGSRNFHYDAFGQLISSVDAIGASDTST